MPGFDEDDHNHAVQALDEGHQRLDVSPTIRQKLGPFTVMCLVLNRTIGSGIFVTPVDVFNGTGSIGVSLFLWSLGGIVGICGCLVWLELGLSVPLRFVPGQQGLKSVPRSGGEKNYLEFIYTNQETGRPRFLVTCLYGIAFVILGNLSGNAIAFGTFVMSAAGQSDPSRASVIGIAIAALTAVVSLHVCSRRGGIWVNNAFAVMKVLLLVAIIVLGWVKAAGVRLGGAPPATNNFDPDTVFETNRRDVASYADSFLLVVYSMSGYKQPFYVLSEVANPRKVFPRFTLLAMFITTVLFVLVNVSYFCAVPKDMPGIEEAQNMAIVFFSQLFGNEVAKRVMSGCIAFSIFGNLLVMTFTASRVKQEIAKEGILPWSLFFATSHTTPLARWFMEGEDEHLEQTPMAALGLHWLSSIILIAVTSMLEVETSYHILISLYSYVINVLIGFIVAGGLLYLKMNSNRRWSTYSNFKPWLDPLPAVLFTAVFGFLLFATFAKPHEDSPFSFKANHVQWFVVPTVGLSSLSWGFIWFLGFHLVMFLRGQELIVSRVARFVTDGYTRRNDIWEVQWVQESEIVTHEWHAT